MCAPTAIPGIPYSCQPCNFVAKDRHMLKRHEETVSHAKATEPVKSSAPPDTKYVCRPCRYGTNRRSDFTTHERTKKHVSIVSGNHSANRTRPTWYTCEPCDYKTLDKFLLVQHKRSERHKLCTGADKQ